MGMASTVYLNGHYVKFSVTECNPNSSVSLDGKNVFVRVGGCDVLRNKQNGA
jgi:hypothetical protein